jgi:hypothetical protein
MNRLRITIRRDALRRRQIFSNARDLKSWSLRADATAQLEVRKMLFWNESMMSACGEKISKKRPIRGAAMCESSQFALLARSGAHTSRAMGSLRNG